MLLVTLDDIICGAYCHLLDRTGGKMMHIPTIILDAYAHDVERRLRDISDQKVIIDMERDKTTYLLESNPDIFDINEWHENREIILRDDVTIKMLADRFVAGIPAKTLKALTDPSCVEDIDCWFDEELAKD